MRLLLFVLVMIAAAAPYAHAAPWSFELPEGYTEQPGAADGELAQLRSVPRTVSADAQVYLSADGSVRLTRMTWLSQFDVPPTRGAIESMERDIAAGNARGANRAVSQQASFADDQLVADQVLELERLRVDMRRIYAADTANVVHMFTVICAGPADELADCEKAQDTMQLVLPNQAAIGAKSTEEERGAGLALVLALSGAALVAIVAVFWLVRRSRKR